MRIWKGTLLILLVLLMLTACGAEHSTSSEPDSTQNASESATQYSNLEDDASDDAPLEWPVELMGDILPVPSGVITSIDRGDTSGEMDSRRAHHFSFFAYRMRQQSVVCERL